MNTKKFTHLVILALSVITIQHCNASYTEKATALATQARTFGGQALQSAQTMGSSAVQQAQDLGVKYLGVGPRTVSYIPVSSDALALESTPSVEVQSYRDALSGAYAGARSALGQAAQRITATPSWKWLRYSRPVTYVGGKLSTGYETIGGYLSPVLGKFKDASGQVWNVVKTKSGEFYAVGRDAAGKVYMKLEPAALKAVEWSKEHPYLATAAVVGTLIAGKAAHARYQWNKLFSAPTEGMARACAINLERIQKAKEAAQQKAAPAQGGRFKWLFSPFKGSKQSTLEGQEEAQRQEIAPSA